MTPRDGATVLRHKLQRESGHSPVGRLVFRSCHDGCVVDHEAAVGSYVAVSKGA